MNIMGLIEIRPFDGTDPFVCLRVNGPMGMFDLPITGDQLQIIMSNYPNQNDDYEEESEEPESEDTGMYTPSPVIPKQPTQDSNVFTVQNSAEFSMGQSSSMWEDDDL